MQIFQSTFFSKTTENWVCAIPYIVYTVCVYIGYFNPGSLEINAYISAKLQTIHTFHCSFQLKWAQQAVKRLGYWCKTRSLKEETETLHRYCCFGSHLTSE